MRCAVILALLLVICVYFNECKDFTVGTRVNNLLISTEKYVVKGYPLIKRDKTYTYVDSKQRIIKGIIARDLSRTDAEVTLISGGVGASNVTLHLKSERGNGLNYLILVFAENN